MSRLTAAERRDIPPGRFGLPKKKEYPLEDVSHARFAVSMVEKNGTPAEEHKVLAKVHRLYPRVKIAALKQK